MNKTIFNDYRLKSSLEKRGKTTINEKKTKKNSRKMFNTKESDEENDEEGLSMFLQLALQILFYV